MNEHPPPDTSFDPNPALAFAALSSIMRGDWDRFLLRLRAGINQRIATDEWKHHIVAKNDGD